MDFNQQLDLLLELLDKYDPGKLAQPVSQHSWDGGDRDLSAGLGTTFEGWRYPSVAAEVPANRTRKTKKNTSIPPVPLRGILVRHRRGRGVRGVRGCHSAHKKRVRFSHLPRPCGCAAENPPIRTFGTLQRFLDHVMRYQRTKNLRPRPKKFASHARWKKLYESRGHSMFKATQVVPTVQAASVPPASHAV